MIAVSLNNEDLPVGRKNLIAEVYDAASGELIRTLISDRKRRYDKDDFATSAYGVCFSSDGRQLATAGGDKTVRIWDVETGHQLLVFEHPNQVFTVEFSPHGRWLASGSGHWCGPRPGEVRIWDGLYKNTKRQDADTKKRE